MSWILSWLSSFPSPEPPLPSTTFLLPSSYPTLWLPVLPPLSTHPPDLSVFLLVFPPPSRAPHLCLTVFLPPWTFSALSHYIILPYSLQASSSYQQTASLFFVYHSSPSHSHLVSQNSPTSCLCSAGPYLSKSPYFNYAYKFPELQAKLLLLFPRKVVVNNTCSDPSTAEMVILQLPLSRFLWHFGVYAYPRCPKTTCLHREFTTEIGTEMIIPWTLISTDSATLAKSDQFPLVLISFQSACLHLMFNSLVISLPITQISDPPAMSMRSLCSSIFLRTVGEALAYRKLVYSGWSLRPENAETWVIVIFSSVAMVLVVIRFSLATNTISALCMSPKVNLPVSLPWQARKVLSSLLLLRTSQFPVSRAGALFCGTFRAFGVFGILFLMWSILAGYLLNATAFLKVRFSWLLVHIETTGTPSSACIFLWQWLVTSSILFCLPSTKAYHAWVHTTADVVSLSLSSKCLSLSSSVSLSSSSFALLTPCPSSCTVSLSLNSLIRSSLTASLPSWGVEWPESSLSLSDSCWAIPEWNTVTWELALWNTWHLATCWGWGGCGATVVATPSPCCPCRATMHAYSWIYKNLRSSRYPDISPPFPPLCSKGSFALSLK